MGVAAARASGTAFAAHEVAEHVAHVGLDLLRVLAGFEALDGDVEFLGAWCRAA